MRKLIKKLIPERFIRSISTRLTFFMLFALSVSSLLAGTFLTIIYVTDLKTTWELTPIKITLIALGISYVSSGIFSIVLNKNILKPLNELTRATKEIAAGNFNIKLDNVLNTFNQNSELGTLVDGFNNMAGELKSTEMFRNDFIHNFSHEFKTPIVSIAGFAKLLKQDDISDEQKREYINIIEDESLRLSYLATNVLDLTKIENQTILRDTSIYNVSEQIRTCVLMTEEKWTKKNLDIRIDINEYYINGNEELLKQVWLNLLDNAIKFANENGWIHIDVAEKGRLHITITNSGSSIDEENYNRIFNKFYQEEKSHSTQGNGIGLAIVKKIVDLHKGEIKVHSEQNITSFTVII